MNRSAGFSLISTIVYLAVIIALLVVFFKATGLDKDKGHGPAGCIDVASDAVKQANRRAVETNQALER